MTSSPRVVSLHRYPVKSLLGEQVPQLDVDVRGCAGDRVWSVRTVAGKIGSGKSTRRFAGIPGLLDLRAATRDRAVVITFPDGSECAVDDPSAPTLLSAHLRQPVTVAAETDVSHFDDGAISLLGVSSVRALERVVGAAVDSARFRANVVLDTAAAFEEDSWVGRELVLGSAVLRVEMRSPRCVMVDAATADLPSQPGNLAAVGRVNAACLGVIASVVRPGRVDVGDALSLNLTTLAGHG